MKATERQQMKIKKYTPALIKYRSENPTSKKDDFGVFASSETKDGKLYFSEYYNGKPYHDEVCLKSDGNYEVNRLPLL